MIRIKELRNKKGISQQALADVLHVTQQAIYKYEHGLAEPDIDTLIACARYFDTSVDYLIGATDNPQVLYEVDNSTITSSEKTILEAFRKLSDSKQQLLVKLISEDHSQI